MEGLQGDIGLQVLHAVQALGGRMDRLETQVGRLTAQVERLEQRMDVLEQRMGVLEQRMDVLAQRMEGLEKRVTQLEFQMERLNIRMDKQEMWMERLGGEFISTRDTLGARIQQVSDEVRQMRGEMEPWCSEVRLGFRRVDARIDVTAGAVVLLAADLRGPTKVEYSPQLESHLRDLKVH